MPWSSHNFLAWSIMLYNQLSPHTANERHLRHRHYYQRSQNLHPPKKTGIFCNIPSQPYTFHALTQQHKVGEPIFKNNFPLEKAISIGKPPFKSVVDIRAMLTIVSPYTSQKREWPTRKFPCSSEAKRTTSSFLASSWAKISTKKKPGPTPHTNTWLGRSAFLLPRIYAPNQIYTLAIKLKHKCLFLGVCKPHSHIQ